MVKQWIKKTGILVFHPLKLQFGFESISVSDLRMESKSFSDVLLSTFGFSSYHLFKIKIKINQRFMLFSEKAENCFEWQPNYHSQPEASSYLHQVWEVHVWGWSGLHKSFIWNFWEHFPPKNQALDFVIANTWFDNDF